MEVYLTGERVQDKFRVFFLKYYQEMVRYASSYTRETVIAEDLVQDTFIQLWIKREETGGDGLKNYLLLSVKNRCLNYLRHRQVEDMHLKRNREQMPEECTDEEESYVQEEVVRKLFDKIPSKRRRILELSVVECKSYRDISILLGISQNTVKAHLKRAYAFLREEVKNIDLLEMR